MTARGISEILGLFEAAYRVEFLPHEIKAWSLLLSPISDDEGKRAAALLCQKSPYIPKPADIFRLVEEHREAYRIPEWHPVLPEPQDPEVAARWRTEIREKIVEIAVAKTVTQ